MQGTEHIAPKTSGTAASGTAKSSVFFQPKLTVNQPDDLYEQEADATADRVIHMAVPAGGEPKGMESELEEKHVQHKGESRGAVPHTDSRFEQYVAGLGGRGNPLLTEERRFFESRFNRDFSDVRIHTDNAAAQSAHSIHAYAYTSGTNVVFGAGQYQPSTEKGRRLMAHELTHVVQQKSDSSGQPHSFIQREEIEDIYKGTRVYAIVINKSNNRIGFLTDSGFILRGTVDTDIDLGFYTVRVNFAEHKWVFDPKQVKSGLRFWVTLEKAIPWTLSYVEPIPLTVTNGFSESEQERSPTRIKEQIVDLIDAKNQESTIQALEILSNLNAVDLGDLLHLLKEDGDFALMALGNALPEAMKQGIDVSRLLFALDAVNNTEDELYIDNFSNYYVDPSSFGKPDPEREKQGKWNIKIIFTYDLFPARAINLYADDIKDDSGSAKIKPTYGEGGLLYPPRLSKGTVPKMWAAKKAVIDKIEEGNIEFIGVAHAAAESVINLMVLTQSLLTATLPSATNPRMATQATGLRRPITEAFNRQPGRWLDDFQGGSNMSKQALEYEARACNKDPGKGYYKDNVQFDGYENSKLVDAKYYPKDSKMTKSLQGENYFVGNKLLDQARRQLRAAGSTSIEWRVASEEAASKIRQLFQANDINITVVFFP